MFSAGYLDQSTLLAKIVDQGTRVYSISVGQFTGRYTTFEIERLEA